jgi:hypothetical protein
LSLVVDQISRNQSSRSMQGETAARAILWDYQAFRLSNAGPQ